jgi:hypothetical protein
MNDWSSGYVTDVGYLQVLYRELTPSILHLSALAAGFVAPDPNAPLKYCELGCGHGFSANLLAAASPQIEFHAMDFNPGFIHGARLLAQAAGTANVHFHEKSFAEFAVDRDLPEFDIIALHGVYSWISSENRRHIVDFIRKKLRVGGLVYVSYDALPGWSAIMPLRRLMADFAGNGAGPTSGRVEQAIQFVQRLAELECAYFRANPAVADRLERIKTGNRNYLAHEYFNRDLTAFHHADVAAELGGAKLTYVGSAHILDNLDAVNLTVAQENFLKGIAGSAERETMRDYLINQFFRRDIFMKGPVALSIAESRASWTRMRFALSTPRAEVPLTARGMRGEVTLGEDVHAPVLDALAEGPRTTGQLLAEPKVGALGSARLLQALLVLVGSGHLQPALDADGDAERSARAKFFNDAASRPARKSRKYTGVCLGPAEADRAGARPRRQDASDCRGEPGRTTRSIREVRGAAADSRVPGCRRRSAQPVSIVLSSMIGSTRPARAAYFSITGFCLTISGQASAWRSEPSSSAWTRRLSRPTRMSMSGWAFRL